MDCSLMSNVQTNYRLKLEFQKMNQHKGEKWLVYGTKHYKENIILLWMQLVISAINFVVVYLISVSKRGPG